MSALFILLARLSFLDPGDEPDKVACHDIVSLDHSLEEGLFAEEELALVAETCVVQNLMWR